MQHPSHELIDRLAAEYVLGTLRGRARARFDRWLVDDDAMRRRSVQVAVRRWEDRLVHLADGVAPVAPEARVWREIARRTGQRSPTRWALAASVLLVALGSWLWLERAPRADWQAVAELRDPARAAPLWRIEVDREGRRLLAVADQPYGLTDAQVHELWALPGDGGPPVSLGLLPRSGRLERELSAAQRDALGVARQLAVSVEPAGGSPTGAPTGPVVLVVERVARG